MNTPTATPGPGAEPRPGTARAAGDANATSTRNSKNTASTKTSGRTRAGRATTTGMSTAASAPPPPAPSGPQAPPGAEAWNVRSWALLTTPPGPVAETGGLEVWGGDGDETAPAPPTAPAAPPPPLPPSPAARRASAPPPHGPADPVRELMHRHRALCERSVDPLEIAAGLEAHGVTDRTAARFRHRDVFSLAEELFARVPRGGAVAEAGPGPGSDPDAAPERGGLPRGRIPGRPAAVARTLVLPLLPALLCALALASLVLPAVSHAGWPVRATVLCAGTVAVVVATAVAVRRVGRAAPGLPASAAACLLAGSHLLGGRLLLGLLDAAGPNRDGGGALSWLVGAADGYVAPAMPLTLACGAAFALWWARWFAVRARRTLAGSISLDEFAAGMRPVLAVAVLSYAAVLFALALTTAGLSEAGWASAALTGGATTALGVLLLTALLLTAHGFPGAARAGLGLGCLLEAAALGSVLAGRLPGGTVLGRPVAAAVAAAGPAVVPGLACAVPALVLLAYAFRVLTRASAHHSRAES